MRLEDELKLYGCEMDAQSFRECLANTFANMFKGYTDEQMLCEPDATKDFDRTIRRIVNCPGLPDSVINKTILNMRKHG